MAKRKNRAWNFILEHPLSLGSSLLLTVWIVLYIVSDPATHWGSFFGNAIADWSGVVVTVFATKHLYEKNSTQSRKVPPEPLPEPFEWMRDHSLTIFLLVTGIFWTVLYIKMDSEGKWGQVVGNIVSEWTQTFGLVLLTKRMIARHYNRDDAN
jgi:hypothetical protein